MSELVYLPVEKLWPHPDNPRKVVDDLEELAASIRENGVLQNLTVVHVPEHTMDEGERRKVFEQTQENGVDSDEYKLAKELLDSGKVPEHYTVIIGHRRLAAAKMAGLESVPCVISEMTEKEQLQTMIMENMQRKDLKVYEEANAFQQLLDFGDTMEEVSQKSGFSVTTIKRRVKLTELNQTTLKEVVDTRQISLSDFDELAKIDDLKKRNEVLENIGTDNFKHCVASALREQEIKKKLPEIDRMIKDNKLKEINSSDPYYNNAYKEVSTGTKFITEDWPEKKKELLDKMNKMLAKNKGSKPCYVLDKYWGEIRLYVKVKEEKSEQEKKENAEAKVKAKEAQEAWEELKRQCGEIQQLRESFIENLKCTTKNKTTILQGALMAGVMNGALYNGEDHDSIKNLLNVDETSMEWDQREVAYANKIIASDVSNWPKLAYYLFGDRPDRCLTTSDGYKKQQPKYKAQAKMLLLYDWLQKLGYKMSDKEKALVYGSDEIYENAKADSQKPVHAGGAAEAENGEPGEV